MGFFHAFAFVLLVPVVSFHVPRKQWRHTALDQVRDDDNFVFTRQSESGGLETFLSYNGISTTEVQIPSQEGLYYMQTTDGRHLIHMSYQGLDDLLGCHISKDQHDILTFQKKFLESVTSRESIRKKNLDDLTDHLKVLGDFKRHQQRCEAFINQAVKSERLDNHQGTYLGKSHRWKRVAMIPGTKWCGTGSTAAAYEDLGVYAETDKCCRDHDKCPYMIPRFTTHYNLFNYRPYTISHCDCDVSFQKCLKEVDDNISKMVAAIYSTLAGPCFILKEEVTCEAHSWFLWWSSCTKHKVIERAQTVSEYHIPSNDTTYL